MLDRGDPSLGADRRRLVVVDVQREPVRQSLLDEHRQRRLARPQPGLQLRIQPPEAWILQELLQPLLERVDVQRRPGAEGEPLAQVARAKPAVPVHLDVGQLAFDDLVDDDTAGHVLIGQDRSGVDVPPVDVESGQSDTEILQILGRELPINVRRRDPDDLLGREDRTAHDADLAHENLDGGHRCALGPSRRGRRGQDRGRRGRLRLLSLESGRIARATRRVPDRPLRAQRDGQKGGCSEDHRHP